MDISSKWLGLLILAAMLLVVTLSRIKWAGDWHPYDESTMRQRRFGKWEFRPMTEQEKQADWEARQF